MELMNKLRICVIGAGNITNTRHIPAILKNKSCELVGVISDMQEKIERTNKKYNIKNTLVIDHDKDIMNQLKACSWFMEGVDAVVIGTPPKQHFPLVKATLILKKHTLIEKPMMMDMKESEEVVAIAKKNNVILNVMHSFQFSKGMMEISKRFESGEFGKIESIVELQLTNRKRRLPKWYNDLPLGLFYDEAAHFFYGAMRFGNGELQVKNAHAQFNNKNENTPKFLQVQLQSGDVPVQMFMNFNSPICEWGLMLLCEKKIVIYDYFKDIVIVLENDGEHLAKNVLKTSLSFTIQFWLGFIKNGFKMVTNNLLYGHDVVINYFIEAINTGISRPEIDSAIGTKVVKAMNEVVELVEGKQR